MDQVEGYYNSLLNRPADPASLLAWANSGNNIAAMAQAIESSAEFYTNS